MTQHRSVRDDTRIAGGRRSPRNGSWRPRWGDALVLAGLALLLGSGLGTADSRRPQLASTATLTFEPAVRRTANRILDVLGTPQRLVLLIDLSASMSDPVPRSSPFASKWDLVRRGSAEFLRELPDRTVVGLRVFGQSASRCAPSERLRTPAPLGPDGAVGIIATLDRLTPVGDTPLADTLESAAEDLGPLGGQILLLSDGMDTCGGLDALCASARAVAARGVPVRIDVVRTFVPEDEGQALTCVSEATGGTAVDLLGTKPDELAALLFRTVPVRQGAAVLLIAFGWLTFFTLCSLLADALGALNMVRGRAGFISDLVFALAASSWATFWLLRVARLPLVLAFALVGGTLALLYREIPRRRSTRAAALADEATG